MDGCSFIYATDNEHRNLPHPDLVGLARDADILYYDTQYLSEEYPGLAGSVAGPVCKMGWGHSTYEFGVWTALDANVKTLLIGHHEPKRDDIGIELMEKRAQDYASEILGNYPGQELEVVAAFLGLSFDLYAKDQ